MQGWIDLMVKEKISYSFAPWSLFTAPDTDVTGILALV